MNRKYLEDYGKSELEEHKRFRKMVINGKFGPTDIFPPKERFVKVTEPIALSVQATPEIWPQVPFAGSTIVMLYPVRKELFKKAHGFKISDIDRLVDFIKETGKIQFAIDWPPTAFEGLDFLDPIFIELKPPSIPWPSELWPFTEAQQREFEVEFDALADINFREFIRQVFSKESHKDTDFLAKRMYDYQMDYLALKALGLQDLSEEVGNLMVDDPPKALQAFLAIGAFVCLPLMNPLRATFNYDLNLLTQAKKYTKLPNLSFPCEIGKFLMTKLTYYPESLTACQELIAHYKDYDLLNLVSALNDGIKRSDIDLVNVTKESLSQTLDNIWNDTTIQTKIKGIKVGFPVSLAALGAVAAGPIGALGGFLGGLGFSVGSTIFKIGTDKLGEKTAKRLSKSYQVNIYNFKKKYNLK